MTFLITVFIILFFIYALPRILIRLLPFLIKRRVKKVFSQANGQTTGRSSKKNKADAAPRNQPAKKIDPNVGEYVHFEEIQIKEESATKQNADGSETRTTRFTVEEQIVDVEWEDV